MGATQGANLKADEKRTETLKAIAAKIDGGDIKGGRADALKLLERRADDITVLRLVAHTHLAEKHYVEAERFYARASALAPDNAKLKDDVTIARVLQKDDREVLAHARRGLDSPTQRKTGMRLLLRLTDRSPDSSEAYLSLVDGYTADRKPALALIALHEAEQRADEDQIGQVISRAEKLAREHPDIGLPHNILGRAQAKVGRFNEAINELEIAVDLTQDKSKYVIDLADAYIARANEKLARGDAAGATPDLLAARDLDPFSRGLAEATAQVALHDARRDVMLGRYVNALRNLNTAARNGPDDASFKKKVAALYASVGAHFRDSGGDTTALAAFAKAYELNPSSVVAQHNVGTLAHTAGLEALDNRSYDTAIDNLEQAYETEKTNTTYQQDLARAYDARGQDRQDDDELAEAIEDFKRAYRLDPTNASIEANLTAALS
ncbi:MAG: tetratricopeptide repeat protein [Planctomycetota bacterium]|jgi:tetratricopeptide (TPR) repeat protein